MKKIINFTLILLSFFALFSNQAVADFHQKNTKVVILATGGTISGAGDSSTNSKYSSAKIDISEIIKKSAGIEKFSKVEAKQIIQKASQDLEISDWLLIAREVDKIIKDKSVSGIVITHGTDTMEETAYFLNLVIKSEKPIILTGSMRPQTSISSDAEMNLLNAVAIAANKESKNKGVMITMNDQIFSARDATKSHTTNVAAFSFNEVNPIGSVYYGKVNFFSQITKKHTIKSDFDIRKISTLEKVDIVYIHAQFDCEVLNYYQKSNSKALIIAGVGDGNANKKTIEKLGKLAAEGVLIVRASNVGNGEVEENIEVDDEKLGFITAKDLSAKKARILAMIALTKTNDLKKIKKYFAKY
jgi:L-asparaginase